MNLEVKYEKSVAEFPLETREGSAGIDLYVAEDVSMKKGDFKLISMGVVVRVPKGFYTELVPRSSTFKKYGLIQTNSVGIIDNSYCGNEDIIKMPVFATRDTEVKRGDRICQLLVKKDYSLDVDIVGVETMSESNRGGFGSTDTEVRRFTKEKLI